MRWQKVIVFLFFATTLLMEATVCSAAELSEGFIAARRKVCLEWRKERDEFLKTHSRSPLTPEDREKFKSLTYYPYEPKYLFRGPMERYIFHINNPKYYATFLTNKGVNKRYLRYGKFRFSLDGKEYSIEVYKSLLSDNLFIPFKDKTNGKETYEGGRYIDAEILPGYEMVLDFNMAYYPSCAYNSKFICALPPRENTLPVEITAGERDGKWQQASERDCDGGSGKICWRHVKENRWR
jgi:uncharacterized protein (DUF1684 family)